MGNYPFNYAILNMGLIRLSEIRHPQNVDFQQNIIYVCTYRCIEY